MIEEIINSKVKVKLLKLFCEGGSFHVSEAARAAKTSKSRASECLKGLAKQGILESKVVGKSIVYSLSTSVLAKKIISPLCQDVHFLDEIAKDFLKEAKRIGPLSIAIFGSSLYQMKLGSDVDFFVISDKKGQFYSITSKLTEKLGIRVSATVMDMKEFRGKAKIGEEFVINVLANHKMVYGEELENLIWQGK